MTIEQVYDKACEIIAYAGDSKSYSMEAIQNAEDGVMEEVEACFKNADESLTTAHNLHTELLVEESNGLGSVPLNMMLIHASDHLTAAELTRDFAEKIVNIYKTFNK